MDPVLQNLSVIDDPNLALEGINHSPEARTSLLLVLLLFQQSLDRGQCQPVGNVQGVARRSRNVKA